MKTLFASIAIAFSLLLFSGCATTTTPATKEAVAYTSLATTWKVAKAVYQEYADLVAKGEVKPNDQRDIDKAWNDFRTGMRIAVIAARGGMQSPTPDNVESLKNDLITLIKSL